MVTFAQFWGRLKSEFSHAPSPRPGVHVISVKKWSQFSGEMSGRFSVIYQSGNVLHGDTAGTNNWRNISEAEFPQGLRGVAGLSRGPEKPEVHHARPRG